MANVTKRDFDILDANGDKYLEWKVDFRANLKAKGIEHTIMDNNSSRKQEQSKAIVLLRHHLSDNLKSEYLFVDDPKVLWDNLNARFQSLERIIGSKALHDWVNIKFQDFTLVSEYDYTLMQNSITMHTDNNILQVQYRERQYTRYSDLIVVLRMAEARRNIMWHNQNKRPVGNVAPLETYVMKTKKPWQQRKGGNFANKGSPFINRKSFQKENGKWCGIIGHWASECRTTKHLADLYVASQKGKGKDIKNNLIEDNNLVLTLDVADYLVDDIEDVAGPSV
ncbi:hypothetical protein RND81_09G090000 [Saponaria officinalis]|uniref:Uncharacterized protein n=1 Tax=Saponaria officinalis TaxID=3572 RepID=A0AAW1IKK7_SAPOF